MKLFVITWRNEAPNGGLIFFTGKRKYGPWCSYRGNAKTWKTKTGATKAMLQMYLDGAPEGSLMVRTIEGDEGK